MPCQVEGGREVFGHVNGEVWVCVVCGHVYEVYGGGVLDCLVRAGGVEVALPIGRGVVVVVV